MLIGVVCIFAGAGALICYLYCRHYTTEDFLAQKNGVSVLQKQKEYAVSEEDRYLYFKRLNLAKSCVPELANAPFVMVPYRCQHGWHDNVILSSAYGGPWIKMCVDCGAVIYIYDVGNASEGHAQYSVFVGYGNPNISKPLYGSRFYG